MNITLIAQTPLEKEVAKRVKRGVKMLDAVTPEWWKPINPATLVVSNREFCVFAQAHHNFKTGIIQVAEAAAAQGAKVRTLPAKKYFHMWNSGWSRRSVAAESRVVDVFYYGFDVDEKLEELANSSRRTAWGVIDKMWQSVVNQKKGIVRKPLRTVREVLQTLRDEELMREDPSDPWVNPEIRDYAQKLRERISGLR